MQDVAYSLKNQELLQAFDIIKKLLLEAGKLRDSQTFEQYILNKIDHRELGLVRLPYNPTHIQHTDLVEDTEEDSHIGSF